MPYGEIKPRLVSVSANPSLWSKVQATSRMKDGYKKGD